MGPFYQSGYKYYYLSCNYPDGIARNAMGALYVLPPLPPAIDFSATPSSIKFGQTTKLIWNIANATSCTASNAWSGAVAFTGETVVGPLQYNTTYTIKCDGYEGTHNEKSVTVTVGPQQPLQSADDIGNCPTGTVCACVGNPINAGNGNKFQVESDYVGVGAFPLTFKRFYNSHLDVMSGSLGAKWRHSYDSRVIEITSTQVVVVRPDGKDVTFNKPSGTWVALPSVVDRLEKTSTGWKYTDESDSVETYDSSGVLTSITNRFGLTTQLAYTAGQLTSITDPFGRALTLTYLNGRIDTLTDPAGGLYKYEYTADTFELGTTNLTKVTYPGSDARTYQYGAGFNDSVARTYSAFPNALTGILDENNNPFATWKYDVSGRAVESFHAAALKRARSRTTPRRTPRP